MKTLRNFVIAVCAIALSAGVVSCKKDKKENGSVVKASIAATDGGSKTSIGGLVDGDNPYYPVLWSADDQIAVFSGEKTDAAVLTLTKGAGTQSGEFSGATIDAAESYLAAYPATATRSGNTITFDLTDDYQAGPMAAYSTDGGNFNFNTLLTMVKFSFHGTAGITKVVVKDESKPFDGTLTATWNGTNFVTAYSGGSSTTKELSCTGTNNGADYSYDVSAFFVPEGTLASFTLTFYAGSDVVKTLTKTLDGGVQAGQSYDITMNDPIVEGYDMGNAPEFVELIDFGGSVIWASAPMGATTDNLYGEFYAWGEIEPNHKGSASVYRFKSQISGQEVTKFSKYVTYNGYGTVDGKYLLDDEDNVVKQEWGGDWDMPTKDEMHELFTSSAFTKEWKKNYNSTGKNGLLLTLKSDNTKKLFFPAAGYYYQGNLFKEGARCYFWTKEMVHTGNPGSNPINTKDAYYVFLYCDKESSPEYASSVSFYEGAGRRCYSYCVLPIIRKNSAK